MKWLYKNPKGLFYLLFAGLSLFPFSCSDSNNHAVTPAFYFWKNSLKISAPEFEYLSSLHCKKLYIRFFDVDWEGQDAVPLSILENDSKIPDSIEIIPTVFITNRTMLNIADQDIPELADKIAGKIGQLSNHFQHNQIPEIQFDCDWSANSQKKYFQLLRLLKSHFTNQNKKISATIRLHQVKYFKKTGVPDVDRGVLMFYNMDDINDWETTNSILDIAKASPYLYNFETYPIPLDIALPIFKWGLVFQEEKLVKIINNLDQSDLQDSTRFHKIGENRFEIIKSTYIKGYYLYKNDQIRLEKTDIEDLKKAADLLSPLISNQELNIIFYHLDSTLTADYPYEALQDIYRRFH